MSDETIVKFFQRHIIPIHFAFQKENDIQNIVVTSFILSVSDHWFLVTAGHCIRQINELIERTDVQLVQCQLIDSLGQGAKHLDPIPFTYRMANPIQLSDDYAFDYGFIPISLYYRGLLEKNNVAPLTEAVWKFQPNSVIYYLLMGIPGELVKVNPDEIAMTPTLLHVEPVSEKPDGFTDVDAPLFYGRIILDDSIQSIKGMSGGPIFAFQKYENGDVKYFLTALQSRWNPYSYHIAACPVELLGNFLESLIASID